MATNNLKFFHVSTWPADGAQVEGGIYFNSTTGEIAVGTKSGLEHYSGVVKDVAWEPVTKEGVPAGGKLVITRFDESKVELDFSDVASATQVAKDISKAVADLKTIIDAYTVNGKGIATNPVLNGADVKLDGYTKPETSAAIAATDTVNVALGKLEKAIEATGGDALTHVTAGNGIDVTDKADHNQTISVKIDEDSEDFLTVGEDGLKLSGVQDAIDTAIADLDAEDEAIVNQYVSAVSEEDGVITVSRETLPVTGVASGDKILSLDGTEIKAGLSFSYNSDNRKIYLYGKSTDAVNLIGSVDCTDFIKDGMLYDEVVMTATAASMEVTFPKGDKNTYENLTVGNTYIFLEFNNDGTRSYDKIDATQLVDVYTAGDGLQLGSGATDHQFSIKLASTSDYLTVGASGLTFNDTALHTKIGSEITTEIGKLNAEESNEAAGSGSADSTQIKVTVSEVAGKLDSVAVVAPIFAVPDDIDDLESKLIGTAGDAETADTIWGAKNYGKDAADTAEANAETYAEGLIAALDATAKQNESLEDVSTTGIKALVTEVDGVLTGVTVAIANGTYAKPSDITTAINDLDAVVSNGNDSLTTPSTQIKVQVSEENGKLTAVTVNAQAFDLAGAATTAEANAKAYTDTEIQKLDATVSQETTAANFNGLALQVVEADGKLTSVTGSMNWCEW